MLMQSPCASLVLLVDGTAPLESLSTDSAHVNLALAGTGIIYEPQYHLILFKSPPLVLIIISILIYFSKFLVFNFDFNFDIESQIFKNLAPNYFWHFGQTLTQYQHIVCLFRKKKQLIYQNIFIPFIIYEVNHNSSSLRTSCPFSDTICNQLQNQKVLTPLCSN